MKPQNNTTHLISQYYYGHLAIDCPNIKKEYRSTCFKCEGEYHATEYISRSRVNILKDDFSS